LPSSGLRRRQSTAIPWQVLMSVTASAPPSAAAWAIVAMLATLGVSLAITGNPVAPRTPATTPRQASASVPRSTPWLTLGHDTFSSRAAIPATPSSRAARATNSSTFAPAMLTITGAPQPSSQGSCFARKASTPSLSRPIELSRPAAVSTVRQGTLPCRGCGVIVLGTMPPRRRRSTKPTISRP
jgi:hypothetical protein